MVDSCVRRNVAKLTDVHSIETLVRQRLDGAGTLLWVGDSALDWAAEQFFVPREPLKDDRAGPGLHSLPRSLSAAMR